MHRIRAEILLKRDPADTAAAERALHAAIAIAQSQKARSFELRAGGSIFERDAAGKETVWASVLAYEPPHRLAISWHAGKTPDVAQRLELRFTAENGGTRVELTHSGWEALGDEAQSVRDSYDRGWVKVFEQCYGEYVNGLA